MISVLIEAALRALILALTVSAGLRMLRVSNVPAQKIAWGLVLAAAAAMPLLMRFQVLPPWMTFRVSAAAWRSASEYPPMQTDREASAPQGGWMIASRARLYSPARPQPAAGDRFPAPTISTGNLRPATQVPPAEAQPRTATGPSAIAALNSRFRRLEPAALAGLAYLAICVLLLARMAYGLITAARLWTAAKPFVASPSPYSGAAPGFGLRLRFSPAVCSPVTVGSGVLLPVDCLAWDAEKLRIVLAHERAHIRQGDFYLQLVAGLYAAVFWFSPLGWWLQRKLSELGEAISDRAGLSEAASSASYAQLLLQFAALPRPTLIGVAMARHSNLSERIDRFLDEPAFRRAFASSRRRMLLAVLLVPVALFAATALVRVEAASAQAVPPPPAPAAAPNPAQAPNPAPAPAAAPSAPNASAPSPDAAPSEPAAPAMPPAPAAAAIAPDAPADAPPPPPEINVSVDDQPATASTHLKVRTRIRTNTYTVASSGKGTTVNSAYSYAYSSHDDSWALVTGPGDQFTFSGDRDGSSAEQIEKARKLTSGKFLWFTHEGKSYVVDDPAIVARIQAAYKPIEELGRQQEALGKKQEELGRQQEEMGRKQEAASVPTPDLSKELARLSEAIAKLTAKKAGTISQEELADIEGKLGDVQGRLGELQGEMGEKQGELGELQGKLGEQQGKLGDEQGRLGEQQAKLAEEADRLVNSIIDQSLRNGKARPVE